MQKSISKTVVINIIASFFLQGIVFITTPIFTRLLGTEQYGYFSMFNTWVGLFTCIMGLGVTSTLASGMYQFKDHYLEFKSNILLLGTLISLFIFLSTFLVHKEITELMSVTDSLLFMILLTSFSQMVISYTQSGFIYEKKALSNLIFSILLSVSSVGISIASIHLYTGEDIFMGRVFGITSTYLVCALFMSISIYKQAPPRLKREHFLYGITVGTPIVFHLLSHNILTQSDRVMMMKMNVSSSEIGIYSLFYMLSSSLSVILNAMNTSWCPFYYDALENNDINRLKIHSKNYMELFTVLTVGFNLISREIAYIMADKEFWAGINIIPILVIAVYFTFMYQFPANYEFFYKKTIIIAFGTLFAGVVNIILNWFLIPSYGIYGAAIATALSYLALFAMHYFVVNRIMDGEYYLSVCSFSPYLCTIGISIFCFYFLQKYVAVRWSIGFVIGLWELFRMWKRQAIM